MRMRASLLITNESFKRSNTMDTKMQGIGCVKTPISRGLYNEYNYVALLRRYSLTSGISMRVFQKPPPFFLKLNANLERFLFKALE